MTPDELYKITQWIRTRHAQGRHAVILVVDAKPEVFMDELREAFPSRIDAGKCDFVIDSYWVSARPLLDPVPANLLRDPSAAVCVITLNS